MTKTGWALVVASLLIIVAAVVLFVLPSPTKAPTGTDQHASTTNPTVAQIADTIVVQSLYNGSPVTSPLTVVGTARGGWYFEASFPAEVLDASGTVIAQKPAQAQGDWMTTEFVPFSVTLTYPAQPKGSAGTVVLKKDNPSGDPAREQSLTIPVIFQ